MSKRVKVAINLPTVNTLEEADVMLSEIAARKRNIELIKAGLNESVDALKVKALGCIRIKEEVDKDALRGLKPEDLETVGVKLQKDDGFYYELKEETVGAEA